MYNVYELRALITKFIHKTIIQINTKHIKQHLLTIFAQKYKTHQSKSANEIAQKYNVISLEIAQKYKTHQTISADEIA